MTVLHAGGKFDKDSYKVSGGLHGVGVSCVNALSSHLKTEVHREGKIFVQEYSCGKPLYDVKVVGETTRTGTTQTFTPDASIFITTDYHYDILATRLRELSFLNKGINLNIEDLRTPDADGNHPKDSYLSLGGLREFVEYLDENREKLTPEPIYMEGERAGLSLIHISEPTRPY